jgi:hypothetical protein
LYFQASSEDKLKDKIPGQGKPLTWSTGKKVVQRPVGVPDLVRLVKNK